MNNEISPLPYIGAFIAIIFILLSLGFAKPSHAMDTEAFARDFQAEAIRTYSFSQGRTANFYNNTDDHGYGFRFGGMLDASDRASHMTSSQSSLEKNTRLTTMLLNGTYDLPGFDPNLIFRPYLLAGAGLAVYDTTSSNLSPSARGTSVVPVFKLGGGLAFRMGQVMDLTFSYKAGFAGGTGTGRDDGAKLQMFDIALKYKF
jgi:opacity protein-like surface antigen